MTRPARLAPVVSPRTRQALAEALATAHEHGMVRHEAAIALGNLGTPEASVALRPEARAKWFRSLEQRSRGQIVAETCSLEALFLIGSSPLSHFKP